MQIASFADAFHGQRVFVTGHTGFKGAWLTFWLHRLGAVVTGYALDPPSSPNLYERASIRDLCDSRRGDIRDREGLRKALHAAEPTFVFHLAAQPLVRRSYLDPVETFETNILGTVNVLEAVRSCPSVRVCQIITTDKCYDNREWPYAYRENDALGGHDPYSASKAGAELVTSAYAHSFFASGVQEPTSICSVRAGNVVGGGDFADARIVPDCIRAFADGRGVELRYPRATRPWQYVLDCLSGYLHLATMQRRTPGLEGSWNFGPAPEPDTQVAQVVDRVAAAWGSGHWVDSSDPANPHEASSLRLDCTKAATLLKWRPTLTLDETIHETVGWYRRVHSGENPIQVTEGVLTSYVTRARQRSAIWAKEIQ